MRGIIESSLLLLYVIRFCNLDRVGVTDQTTQMIFFANVRDSRLGMSTMWRSYDPATS